MKAQIRIATGMAKCRICKEFIMEGRKELVMNFWGAEHYHLKCIHKAGV